MKTNLNVASLKNNKLAGTSNPIAVPKMSLCNYSSSESVLHIPKYPVTLPPFFQTGKVTMTAGLKNND